MVLRFRTEIPLAETMVFEDVYEEALRMDARFKALVVKQGVALWMFVDGELAGETYGVSPAALGADPEHPDAHDPSVIWCWSTTLLPPFQGRGLSRILCAYWLGMVRNSGFRTVKGQATTPAMLTVKRSFGAVVTETEPNYAGTARTAHHYTLAL